MAFPLMLAYNYLSSCVEKVEDSAWSEALKYESYVFENGAAEPADSIAERSAEEDK